MKILTSIIHLMLLALANAEIATIHRGTSEKQDSRTRALYRHLGVSLIEFHFNHSFNQKEKKPEERIFYTVTGYSRENIEDAPKITTVISGDIAYFVRIGESKENQAKYNKLRLVIDRSKFTIQSSTVTKYADTKELIDGYSHIHYAHNQIEKDTFLLASFPIDPTKRNEVGVKNYARWVTIKFQKEGSN